jgi:hypothetical protein
MKRKVFLLKRHGDIPTGNSLPFFFLLLAILFSTSACIQTVGWARGDLTEAPSVESTTIILGLNLLGDASSAKVIFKSKGARPILGELYKGKTPAPSIFTPKLPLVYTEGQDHGYLVFDLPKERGASKANEFLLYVCSIEVAKFRRIPEGAPLPIIAYQLHGEYGWWERVGVQFFTPYKVRKMPFLPIGYREDASWTSNGFMFTITQPGVYYLGELAIDVALTFGSATSNNIIATTDTSLPGRTAFLEGTISVYENMPQLIEFARSSGIDEHNIVNYSNYFRAISHEEVVTF